MDPEGTSTETPAEAPEVVGDGYDEAAASLTPTAPAEVEQTETVEYTPPTQEEFAALQAEAERASQYDAWVAEQEWLAQQGEPVAAAEQLQPEQLPTYDPYDPDSVEAYVQAKLDASLNERFEQIEPIIGLVVQEKGQQLAESYFSNLEGQLGNFSHDHAYAVAQGFLESGATPEQAMYQAAVMQHEHEATLRSAAVEEYQQQLKNVQNASAQPGVSGAATEGHELGDYDSISENFLAGLRRPAHVAG